MTKSKKFNKTLTWAAACWAGHGAPGYGVRASLAMERTDGELQR